MSLFKTVYVKLPSGIQEYILARMIKSGRVFQAPVFKMLMHSLQFFGGDLDELRRAFTAPANRDQSLTQICRKLGAELRDRAVAMESRGEMAEARVLYHRAAIYYLLGDWYTHDPAEIEKNYSLMLPCYDKFRQLCDPAIEKVTLPFEPGSLYAHYRVPSNGGGRFPALLIVQGNDEVKEFNDRFETMALEHGLATLTLDPPGWGESGLTGNRFDSAETYGKAVTLAVDFLQSRKEIIPDAIGVFGVSLGGMLAPFAAGLEPRLAAVAGMGGPMIDLKRLWRNVPAVQAARAYLYTGTKTNKTFAAWTDRIDFKGAVGKVQCPVLIVHGEKDELVDPANAHEIVRRVKGKKELKFVPGGDHMCTQTLENATGPYIFAWLARELAHGQRSPERES
ncbi:MAG: alpha/beta hydrolase [Anaerolineae bacterium]|nr:alpha/beta hydrolase [Anaerolineae bacterium]